MLLLVEIGYMLLFVEKNLTFQNEMTTYHYD